jgi:hypothetical protein
MIYLKLESGFYNTSKLICILDRLLDRRDWQRILEEILVRSRIPILGLSQQGEECKKQRRMHLRMMGREKEVKG